MARKKSAAVTKKPAGRGGGAGPAPAAAKKNKNIFKVADAKTNKKRPREVKVKLKRMKEMITTIDVKLTTHHKDMVVKKTTAKVAPKAPAKKQGPANTRAVQQKIGKMKVK